MTHKEKLNPQDVEDILALSPVQEGMLFHFLKEPENKFYHEQLSLTFSGQLDPVLFEETWQHVVQRNEMLRCVYRWRDVKRPVQLILKVHRLSITFHDLSALPAKQQKLHIADYQAADQAESFSLLDVPFRVTLLKLAEQQHMMVMSYHHILCDGWSTGILLREWFSTYHSLKAGELKPAQQKTKYKEYIKWLQKQNREAQSAFWQQYLADFHMQTTLPLKGLLHTDDALIAKNKTITYKIKLTRELLAQLRTLAQQQQVTVASLLYVTWGLLLQRYNNTNDVIFGIPVSGRSASIKGIEDIVGLFINTLPLRVKADATTDVLSLIAQVNQDVRNCITYEYTSLVDVKAASSLDTQSQLFDTLFVVENYPLDQQVLQRADGLHITAYDMHERTHYDLSVAVELFEDPQVVFAYTDTIFAEAAIHAMAHHFMHLLTEIASSPEKRVVDLEIVLAQEKTCLTQLWNQSAAVYPEDKPLHQLFSEQAQRTPDQLAVIFQAQKLTYRNLDERTNRLTRTLQRLGVGPEMIVGICTERSVEMIVGLLAILKAGGAYLPIDPRSPAARQAYFLQDSGARWLLCQSALVAHCSDNVQVLYLDDENIYDKDASPVPSVGGARNLAYIIYTSGSTGQPKGVAMEHRAVVNLLYWKQHAYPLAPGDVTMLKAPYSFDQSVWELFCWAIAGATCTFLTPGQEGNLEYIVQTIERDHVTIMHFIPSMLQAFLEYCELSGQVEKMSRLRYMFAGGEELQVSHIHHFNRLLFDPYGTRLVHLYGPTEACVEVAFYNCSPWYGLPKVPIGRAINNIQLYILDRHLRLQPWGIPGQLCIAGIGLAREYINRPELTRAKFIDHPFAPGQKLYLTGDLARWSADGQVEYLGRLDQQVKLHGFRVELGEIEHHLREHPQIKECAVLVKKQANGDDLLVAYYVADAQEVPVAELVTFLQQRLPGYMVPARFLQLDKMPVTDRGKLDRKALPLPQEATARAAVTSMKPQDDIEHMIAELYQEILCVSEVGLHDNFFEIGGDSLKMIRLYSRVYKALQQEISMTTLFRYPTVASLASYIRGTINHEEQPSLTVEHAKVVEQPLSGDIAVIGLAGRFPGAQNVDAFWENIKQGVESIRFFSDAELLAAGEEQAVLQSPHYVKAKGYLDDFDAFDANLFDYLPSEAEMMDPQMRLLHEVAWEALDHAGYLSDRQEARIGTFVGASANFYWMHQISRRILNALEEFSAVLLNEKDFFSSRLAYKLNLHGPAVTVQTACSTSLVAIHMACQEILAGTCDMALAGAVSITYPPKRGYLYEDGMILSADGHCRAFDEQASGTVSGNGVGIVVLKRLHQALADGDTIHAVIKGSATNNDGSTKAGFTAPTVDGQAAVIQAAQRVAGVTPESISYVEAHGTGTALGDPIEFEALRLAFATERIGYCGLGSVKTNIGHLDVAAGIAGFIKTVLALKHKQLPPSLHYQAPNPGIDIAHSPFYITQQLSPWPQQEHPRRAGVSSFGVGGTNAHVILEEAPVIEPSPTQHAWHLLVLSAKTEGALNQTISRLQDHLRIHPDLNLADVAYTLQVGRKVLPYRKAVVARTTEEAVALLNFPEPDGTMMKYAPHRDRSVIFMFSGQGSQYVNTARSLYQQEKYFRQLVDTCIDLVRPYITYDLRACLYPGADAVEQATEKLGQTEVTQVVLFTLEYALAQTLIAWGIRPLAMIGHSIGEYVAACLAGVFTLEDALKLVAMRGKLMQAVPAGVMLSVRLPEDALLPLLPADVTLAAVNSSTYCVVAGPGTAIEQFTTVLSEHDIEFSYLHTSHAFHSAMMDGILADFAEVVRSVTLHPPRLPYISNLTGTWINVEDATDPQYWVRHLREKVRFSTGLEELLKREQAVLVEVGPGRVLSTFAQRHARRQPTHTILHLLPHGLEQTAELRNFYSKLGQLWVEGVTIDWQAFHQGEKRCRLPLPTYPFEHTHYFTWQQDRPTPASQVDLFARKSDLAEWFYVPGWERIDRPSLVSDRFSRECIVVFADASVVSRSLIERLQLMGCEPVIVRVGQEYCRLEDGSYTVDSQDKASFEAWIADWTTRGFVPTKAIHLWGLASSDAASALESGFYSLIFFAQALAAQKVVAPLDMLVVTEQVHEVTGDEVGHPVQATALGFIKVAPLEYTNLSCRNFDIPSSFERPGQLETLIQKLLEELAVTTDEKVVAYRGRHCWVQRYQPMPLHANDTSLRLRHGGVYLITGGFGGMGLAFARMLTETYQARLLLVSRTPLPERGMWDDIQANPFADQDVVQRIDAVRALERCGATVMVACADVADETQMEAAICEAIARFGLIQGVIHAAGVADYAGLIQNRTRSTTDPILAPKIQGTLNLDRLLRTQPLDFFVVCSSLGNISYYRKLGQIGYSAANEFLDAFARAKMARDGTYTVAINWPDWKEAGMSTASARYWAEMLNMDVESVLRDGVSTTEGVEVLKRVLGASWPQVVVSPLDLHAILTYGEDYFERVLERVQHTRTLPPRLQTASDFTAPQDEMEKILAEIWCTMFGLPQISIHDNFFDLGASSLDLLIVNKKLKEQLHMDISIVTLYEHSTIYALANYLSNPTTIAEAEEKEAALSAERAKSRQLIKHATFKLGSTR